ncbi:putative Zn-dependent peptidase [Caldalkalibacillus uzonensis]|uniref:Zn-dependent peptidase n=1 Tax=Caldalkalibacillus uzonensis TaxID=353224 RepID=A0ABU0CMK2_9BACI|nr:pitrilysin family protein [Caldalkalibacillus uzonensis]MDQ0337323.1 putative Zn-dependent peptidase [Caldalkalibacillus uzonensis]
MADQFQSTRVNQIPVHLISTPKYKTNFISVYIRHPLTEEDHTKVALLPSVLKRGTEKYPTAQHVRRVLDDLYGASLSTDVVKRGEEQVVIFRLQVANEKFLTDQEPLFERGIQLLSEIIMRPRLENGVFHPRHVELEKDLLERKLSQIKDDKIRYANKRCTEEMFKEEPYRLFAYGSKEQLADITPESLYQFYQRVLSTHPVDLFVVGDLHKEYITEMVDKHFNLPRTEPLDIPRVSVKQEVDEERRVVEKTKISQGKLHIGCRTQTAYVDEDYIALLVFNGLFGGFSHSKLFRHVREKESLAYYVNSSIESHKGFMMIMSGIDFNHYDKTVQIIRQQLQETANGHITDEELNQTKAMLINQIREANDQPFQLMERFFHGIVGGKERGSETLIQDIRQVTKEEIQRVAQKVQIDTIYFLTSEETGDAS